MSKSVVIKILRELVRHKLISYETSMCMYPPSLSLGKYCSGRAECGSCIIVLEQAAFVSRIINLLSLLVWVLASMFGY
jgi:hypothetical protein